MRRRSGLYLFVSIAPNFYQSKLRHTAMTATIRQRRIHSQSQGIRFTTAFTSTKAWRDRPKSKVREALTETCGLSSKPPPNPYQAVTRVPPRFQRRYYHHWTHRLRDLVSFFHDALALDEGPFSSAGSTLSPTSVVTMVEIVAFLVPLLGIRGGEGVTPESRCAALLEEIVI